jgi:hypothetical protein
VDVLWVAAPLRGLGSLPPRLLVNQFPFEGCLVRKDLLPATALRAAAMEAASAGSAGGDTVAATGDTPQQRLQRLQGPAPLVLAGQVWPPWFLPSYDLATQAHTFLAADAELRQRAGRRESVAGDGTRCAPRWVVKLAGGTRSADPCVAADAATVLRYSDGGAPGGDRIAQLYADAPLLLCGGRKFDLRVYVAVAAFAPTLTAAVHAEYYGRVAAAPYRSRRRDTDVDDADDGDDFASAFTVGAYAGVPSTCITRGTLAAEYAAAIAAGTAGGGGGCRCCDGDKCEGPAAVAATGDWDADVEPLVFNALRSLFTAAGRAFIGPWPQSRGLYGVDVLLRWEPAEAAAGDGACSCAGRGRFLVPSVLEVNFGGDLTSLLGDKSKLPEDGSRGCRSAHGGFVEAVARMLFSPPPPPLDGGAHGDGGEGRRSLPTGWREL